VSTIPAGYVETRLIDPFEIHVGPVHERSVHGGQRYALLVDKRHVNGRGVVHGGMLLTFADAAFGQAAWRATDFANTVTLGMQAQFIKGVREGALIEVEPEVVRQTRTLLFIKGDFKVRSETILIVQSLWKLLESK